jgi:hypothetical protein
VFVCEYVVDEGEDDPFRSGATVVLLQVALLLFDDYFVEVDGDLFVGEVESELL